MVVMSCRVVDMLHTDVFLTTMKPRQKVVTAQDVESSLYYCHLETVQDAAIRASMQSLSDDDDDENDDDYGSNDIEDCGRDEHDDATTSRILPYPQNPPIEGYANSQDQPDTLHDDLQGLSLAEANTHGGDTQRIARKPIGSVSSSRQPSPLSIPRKPLHSPTRTDFASTSSAPTRRPLGPRPLQNAERSPRPPSPQKENIRPHSAIHFAPKLPPRRNTDNEPFPGILISSATNEFPTLPPHRNTGISRDAAPPPLPLRRGTDMSEHSLASEAAHPRESSSASSDEVFATPEGFKVTIIRRDPVTGGQWNIGQLTKNDKSSSHKSGNSSKVHVEISSGAYDKFVTGEDQPRSNPDDPAFKYKPFRRVVDLRRQRPRDRKTPAHARTNGSNKYQHAPSSPSTSTEPVPFSFFSPWSGCCNFITGAAGRNIRCRHTHPLPLTNSSNSASFDSKFAMLNSTPVSDLRFHLPLLKRQRAASGPGSSKIRPPLSARDSSHRSSIFFQRGSDNRQSLAASPSGLPPALPPRPSQQSQRHHRMSRSFDASAAQDEQDDSEEEQEQYNEQAPDAQPMDLSLGQERAGGGFAGNKAKLGKLVVEGDGMLMLDLVVMANMALWWAMTTK